MAPFVNQDCIDTIVEYVADGVRVAWSLCAVSRGFCVGVSNAVMLAHRREFPGAPGLLSMDVADVLDKWGDASLSSRPQQSKLQHVAFRFCLLALSGPFITRIDLHGCGWPWRSKLDATLVAAAKHCPMLEELDVSGANVGDAGVCAIVRQCPHLHTLDVFGTTIGDRVCAALGAASPNLRRLHIEKNTAITASLIHRCAVSSLGIGVHGSGAWSRAW